MERIDIGGHRQDGNQCWFGLDQQFSPGAVDRESLDLPAVFFEPAFNFVLVFMKCSGCAAADQVTRRRRIGLT